MARGACRCHGLCHFLPRLTDSHLGSHAGMRPARIESLQIVLTLIVRTNVAGEDDERVFRDAEFLQFVEKPTDMAI